MLSYMLSSAQIWFSWLFRNSRKGICRTGPSTKYSGKQYATMLIVVRSIFGGFQQKPHFPEVVGGPGGFRKVLEDLEKVGNTLEA